MTYGPSDSGNRYAVLMLVALLIAVHRATATARFAFGRGIVDETQDRMIWKTENAPAACKNMAWWVKFVRIVGIRRILGNQTYKITSACVIGCGGQNLPNYGGNAAKDDMITSLICSAAMPRVRNGKYTGEDVRRGG